MKFAMSYSCGKDSTLALHRMIAAGHELIALIVMVKKELDRSYFHGADSGMLKSYSAALGAPLIRCVTDGSDYALAFETGLQKAKTLGAEAACFGDIDIAENRAWEEERCARAGLTPLFPLWGEGRCAVVSDLLRAGYRCLIKSVNLTLLPRELLGRDLDEESVQAMGRAGIDICGENGEYHTLALDGPIFKKPLPFQLGEIFQFGDYATIEVKESKTPGSRQTTRNDHAARPGQGSSAVTSIPTGRHQV